MAIAGKWDWEEGTVPTTPTTGLWTQWFSTDGPRVTEDDGTVRPFVLRDSQELTDSGAITIKEGVVILNKAGVIAATLANPTAGTDDGKVLTILSITAQAHTVSNAGGAGFGGGGAGADVGTFGGAIDDCFTIFAWNGVWHVMNNVNVTLA